MIIRTGILSLMASSKVKMINVRLNPDVHDAFKTACELRGGSMSSIMHQFIVRTIREEKEREPQAFGRGSNANAEPLTAKRQVQHHGDLGKDKVKKSA